MRCPVPYALLALLSWGVLDALAERARRLFRPRRAPPARPPERPEPGPAMSARL